MSWDIFRTFSGHFSEQAVCFATTPKNSEEVAIIIRKKSVTKHDNSQQKNHDSLLNRTTDQKAGSSNLLSHALKNP